MPKIIYIDNKPIQFLTIKEYFNIMKEGKWDLKKYVKYIACKVLEKSLSTSPIEVAYIIMLLHREKINIVQVLLTIIKSSKLYDGMGLSMYKITKALNELEKEIKREGFDKVKKKYIPNSK